MESFKSIPDPPPGKSGWPWEAGNAPCPGGEWPKLSLVMPSYNQGDFVEEAIRSVLFQGYPNLEFLFLDGGSTDATAGVMRKYASCFDFFRSEKDGGQSAALNDGFRRATGSIFGWLNSDDVLLPGALFAAAAALRGDPAAGFAAGDAAFCDARGGSRVVKASKEYSFEDLLGYDRGDYLMQPTVFFKADAYREAGGLDERLHYSMDLDLWLKIRKRRPLARAKGVLALLRQHSDSKTVRQNARAMCEVAEVLQRHARGLPEPARRRTMKRLRRFASASRLALASVSLAEGRRDEARQVFADALRRDPAALLRRTALKILARILVSRTSVP